MADMEYRNGALCVDKFNIDNSERYTIDDIENRTEILLDASSKVISYRKEDGTKVENVAFLTEKLLLTEKGMSDLGHTLRKSKVITNDWSDYISNDGDEPLHLPMPKFAVLNITNAAHNAIWPVDKTNVLEYIMQFWDMNGNYLQKNIECTAQGNSSMSMPKKNFAMDMFDSESGGDAFSIKFGEWIPQDSFHLKAYQGDYFIGVCPVGYKLFDQIIATRDIYTNRDWKKALIPPAEEIGLNERALADMDDKYSLDNDARCFPDGFPVIVFLNDSFYGVYSWQIKKHRDNYMMSKKKPLHIHLDGAIGEATLFNPPNGTLNWDIINGVAPYPGTDNYEGFEIRNPKPKKKNDGWDIICIDGTKYDADNNRKELIGEDSSIYDSSNTSHVNTNKTKNAIITLSTYIQELIHMENSGSTTEQIREKIAEFFDVESIIDYLIFSDIILNIDGFFKNWQWITWDGKKWFVEPYDLDGIFGWSGWNVVSPEYARLGNAKGYPTWWIMNYYQTELESRYAFLRDKSIIADENILSILRNWISNIGTDNYQREHEKWPYDKEHYIYAPEDVHKDSIYRISNWLKIRIDICDGYYNYNKN